MNPLVHFETPENIAVTYRLAGPGSRYVAFFVDTLIIVLVTAVLFLAILIAGAATNALGGAADDLLTVMLLILFLAFAFSNVAYYALFEFFLNGQTPGKRTLNLRVVMERGFGLSAAAILIRNVFRILDIIPLLWIVPLVTKKTQRLGDLAAGTIVVTENPGRLGPARERLTSRSPDDAQFTFTSAQLQRLRPIDVRAIETFLDRRARIGVDHRDRLAERFVRGLAARLETAAPASNARERETFLEDLLAAHLRREAQEIG